MSHECEVCHQCSTNTMGNTRKYTFTWRVNDFSLVKFFSNAPLKSPSFSDSNKEFKWYLFFETDIKTSYASLYLNHSKVSDSTSSKKVKFVPVLGAVELSLVDKHGLKKHRQSSYFAFNNKSSGESELGSFNLGVGIGWLYKNTLLVLCTLAYEKERKPPNDFGAFLLNEKFSDVVLSVGERDFPVHKIVLSLRSPVFEAEFSHEMIENRENRVRIEGIKEEVVEEMLRFMYTGATESLNTMTVDLLEVADRYDIEELKERCVKVLAHKLCKRNVIESLIIADVYNVDCLKARAMKFLKMNWREKDVINSDIIDQLHSSHPHLVADILKCFLSDSEETTGLSIYNASDFDTYFKRIIKNSKYL